MGGNGFSSGFFGLVTMLALWGAGCARADDTPAATPYRPTIANPAALSAPGWLEVEAGFQGDRGRDLSGDSVPYLLKYAFTNDWGLLLGGNAYIRNVDLGGQASDGFGDTELLVKHRIPVLDGTAFGFETGARFPTARRSRQRQDGLSFYRRSEQRLRPRRQRPAARSQSWRHAYRRARVGCRTCRVELGGLGFG